MFRNTGFFLALEELNISVLSSLCIVFCRFFMHDIVGMGVVEGEIDSFERKGGLLWELSSIWTLEFLPSFYYTINWLYTKHSIYVHHVEKKRTGSKSVAETSVHWQPISKMCGVSSGLGWKNWFNSSDRRPTFLSPVQSELYIVQLFLCLLSLLQVWSAYSQGISQECCCSTDAVLTKH